MRILVGTFGVKSWYTISKLIQKPLIQCNKRYLELTVGLNSLARKGTWSALEDDMLREQVRKYGMKNWVLVSRALPGRIGKQCRERWHKVLDPRIERREWTLQEDIAIVTLRYRYGKRWAKIARQLKGRTDNSVKNRWNSNLSKILDQHPFCEIREQAESQFHQDAEYRKQAQAIKDISNEILIESDCNLLSFENKECVSSPSSCSPVYSKFSVSDTEEAQTTPSKGQLSLDSQPTPTK